MRVWSIGGMVTFTKGNQILGEKPIPVQVYLATKKDKNRNYRK